MALHVVGRATIGMAALVLACGGPTPRSNERMPARGDATKYDAPADRAAASEAAPIRDPAAGDPGAGAAAVGDPAHGDPMAGEPEAGGSTFAPAIIALAVRDALRVAIGDLDGDAKAEIIAVDANVLRVLDPFGRERARRDVPGGIQVLRIVDLDADGHAEILAGFGRTKDRREVTTAQASILRLRDDAIVEDPIVTPAGERPEIVEIRPIPNDPSEVLVAYFESKYMVYAARAKRTERGWTLAPIDTIRMATSWAIGDVDGDGQRDVVVGRVYGDDVGVDGDAFVLRPDGTRTPIPVVGGVRGLALHDLDSDGVTDILLGDGWNQDYGRLARARLSWSRWTGKAFETALIEETPEQYAVHDIIPADLDGDGRLELVTRGNSLVRTLRPDAATWHGTTLAANCRDAAVADLENDRTVEILILCDDGAHLRRTGPP